MNDRISLAGELTNKQKALGFILLVPSYLLYIPRIAIFFLTMYAIHVNTLTNWQIIVYLNVLVGGGTLAMSIFFFKDFIIDNFRRFKETIIEDTIWSCSVGIGTVYALAIISNIVVMLLFATFNQPKIDSTNQRAVESLLSSAPLIMAMQTIIIAPIVEEVLYRGLLFRTFIVYNKIFAHVMTAFLFGFSHIYSGLFSGDFTQLIHLIPYMAMGFAFGMAYEKRGNLVAPILVHMLNNLIATLLAL